MYNCSINTLYNCSMSCMSQCWLTTVAPEFAWLVALYKYDTNIQPRPAARHTVRSAGADLYRPLTARIARARLHGPRVVPVLVCNYPGACFWLPPPDTCLPGPRSAPLAAAISANEGWIIRTINLSSGRLPRIASLSPFSSPLLGNVSTTAGCHKYFQLFIWTKLLGPEWLPPTSLATVNIAIDYWGAVYSVWMET